MAKKISFFFLVTILFCFALFSPNAYALENNYDVVVVGGEPEGVAAALSAARNGAKTLLVCSDKVLGGTITVANLTNLDMNYGPNRELLTKGIFAEFFQWVKGDSFDVKKARNAFAALTAQEKNLKVMLQTELVKPILVGENNCLVGIEVATKGKRKAIYGKRFIDATGDADLAAQSGVPYTIGREDIGISHKWMAPTLVFQIGNVNWNKISGYVHSDKSRLSGANSVSAWGYGQEMKSYHPLDPQVKLRGLNISRQDDKSVLINALLIFNVDPLNELSVKNAMLRGKKEVRNIAVFLKKRVPGFENSYLVGVADKLYVRESRHIKGEYVLTIDDVLESRNFWDKIALGSYPVDVQAASKEENGFVIGVTPIYSIPFRSLVPLHVDNLLVVGRSASYSSLAAGSARVIPVSMVEGQSAGYAAIFSIHKKMTFRKLSENVSEIKLMQSKLRAQGFYLPEFHIELGKESKEWTYPYMLTLRKKGLIVVRNYKENYELTSPIKSGSFVILLRRSMEILPVKLSEGQAEKLIRWTVNPITYQEAYKTLQKVRKGYLQAIDMEYKGKKPLVISAEIEKKILRDEEKRNTRILMKGEVYALVDCFIEQIKKDLAE